MHSEEAFAALRIKNYKNFLRLKFEPDKLTIYPLGIDKMPGTRPLDERAARQGQPPAEQSQADRGQADRRAPDRDADRDPLRRGDCANERERRLSGMAQFERGASALELLGTRDERFLPEAAHRHGLRGRRIGLQRPIRRRIGSHGEMQIERALGQVHTPRGDQADGAGAGLHRLGDQHAVADERARLDLLEAGLALGQKPPARRPIGLGRPRAEPSCRARRGRPRPWRGPPSPTTRARSRLESGRQRRGRGPASSDR